MLLLYIASAIVQDVNDALEQNFIMPMDVCNIAHIIYMDIFYYHALFIYGYKYIGSISHIQYIGFQWIL